MDYTSDHKHASHHWRGWALNSLGRYREAAQAYNEAARLDPVGPH